MFQLVKFFKVQLRLQLRNVQRILKITEIGTASNPKQEQINRTNAANDSLEQRNTNENWWHMKPIKITLKWGWAQLGSKLPNLGPTWAQLGLIMGPTWAQLGPSLMTQSHHDPVMEPNLNLRSGTIRPPGPTLRSRPCRRWGNGTNLNLRSGTIGPRARAHPKFHCLVWSQKRERTLTGAQERPGPTKISKKDVKK